MLVLGLFLTGCGNNHATTRTSDSTADPSSLARTFLLQNKFDEAEAAFVKAIQLKPDDVSNYADLSLLYLLQKNYDDAEKQARAGLKLVPGDPRLTLTLAEIYRKKGDMAAATRTLNEVTTADPKNIKAWYMLADLGPAGQENAWKKTITAFIIEKEFPGFTVGKKEDKLGIRASSTCELILEDCRVPKANVIGEVGKGYKIAIETLNEGRIGIGAQMAGVARGAWEYAAKYAQERKQFGKPISDFQGIQFQIAQMATEIEAARLMVYNAARMKDAGIPFVKEAAMAKLFSSQVAERVTSLAIEIYGGYGFTKDYPVEKYWRDSKIGKIYEGTSNMQLATIAKLVMSK